MQPLQGVTVLDLSRLLPGPFCTRLLRSWGARVIKVEEPGGGDALRHLQPHWFAALGAGAESVVVDLKQPAGADLLLRLAQMADVVVEGFRPGVLKRLGLGYEQLRQVNPQLVLLSLPGYCAADPHAAHAGHDINYLARSGVLSLMSELPPIQLADLTGGLLGAGAAVSALYAARVTGQGTHVEAPLADAADLLGLLQHAETAAGQPPRRERMVLAGTVPCYGLYATADGHRMALGALEPKFWHGFCAAIGQPEWVNRQWDPTLLPDVSALFASRSRSEWEALAGRGDFCLGPVCSFAEAAVWSRLAREGPVPGPGADTVKVLTEVGLTQQEISALVAEAVIRG